MGPPQEVLPGDFTTFVTHDAKVTVGSVHDGEFLLRTLRSDATWGPTRTVDEVPVYRYTSYNLTGNDAGDLAMTWIRSNGSTGIVVRRDDQWQQPQRVSIGEDWVESVSMDADSAVDVVFTPNRNQVAARSIEHVRRSPTGTWGDVNTLAKGSLIAVSAAANDAGALAVSWEQKYPDAYAWSLRLRYRPADGAWGNTFVRAERTPEQQVAGLAISDAGRLTMGWRHLQQGEETLRFASRSPQGQWSPAQVVANDRQIGTWYGDLAGNGAGETVLSIGAHTQERGVEVVRCPAVGACGAPRTVPEVGYNYPYVFLGPFGTAKLFWDAGCRGEACYSTSVRYIDGR